jgi:hypothetical protein
MKRRSEVDRRAVNLAPHIAAALDGDPETNEPPMA